MTGEEANQTAIRGLVETFVTGWNSADAHRLASAFTEDADFTAINGLHARGRDLIARGHHEILTTIFRGTTLAGEVESVHFLRPDVALVNARFFLRKDGNSFFPGVTHTSAGLVATNEQGAWRIAAFRNMVPFARPVAGPVEEELRQSVTA